MNDVAAIQALLDRYYPQLLLWELYSMRFLGFAIIFPLFSWVRLTYSIRTAFAAAMTAPVVYLDVSSGRALKVMTGLEAVSLSSKELFLGALIGLIAGIPFWAAQSCGELVDTYRGSSAGSLFDPSATSQTSELGTGLILFALATFVWSGAFHKLCGVFYMTYAYWPVETFLPQLKLENALLMGGTGATYLFTALSLASAMLLSLFAIDLLLALFSRSVRQIQTMDISLVVKNLGLAIVMPLIASALALAIARNVEAGALNLEFLRLLLR